MNYKLRIQCFKVTPYSLGDQLFLDVEQIIPMKDSEEYIISMADKTQEDINSQEELKSRHYLRMEFWKALLKEMNIKSPIFRNISPSKDNWISAGSGVSGVNLNFVITHYYARSEILLSRASTDENKFLFDHLHKTKDSIESEFGGNLQWERLDEKKSSRIKYEMQDVSFFNKDDWTKMIAFMTDGMIRMEKAFREPLKKAYQIIKSKEG